MKRRKIARLSPSVVVVKEGEGGDLNDAFLWIEMPNFVLTYSAETNSILASSLGAESKPNGFRVAPSATLRDAFLAFQRTETGCTDIRAASEWFSSHGEQVMLADTWIGQTPPRREENGV